MALLFGTLAVIGPLVRPHRRKPVSAPSHDPGRGFGLAEFPG
jgi:hypothetical protein